jgi:capsule biosynthesis phosphatase
MKLAIDIDGTICRFRQEGQTYADVEPLPGAVEKMQQFRKNGHYIILLTARHMKSCNGNVGLVVARQGKTLLDWLARHEIPYDELWFGKPQADIYIDDNGYRFTSWNDIAGDGSSLPQNREKAEAVKSHPLPAT